MDFNGKFINGNFVPNKGFASSYNLFVGKCEEQVLDVTINIKKAQNYSDRQQKLFFVIVDNIAQHTNSSNFQVLQSLNFMRLMDLDQNIRSFSTYDTVEMTNFIDQAIIHFNSEFNLDIEIIKEQGKSKINVFKKS